jgi:hypothetical protein
MTHRALVARWKPTLPAFMLFGIGAIAGVAVDRLWNTGGPSQLLAAPLTVESMAGALELGAAEQARVTALLDTLQSDISYAVSQGPDSLQAAARLARQRLEQALRPAVRSRFRQWMNENHEMMEVDRRNGGMRRWVPMMEPDILRRWTPPGRGEGEHITENDGCWNDCGSERDSGDAGMRR